MNYKELWQTGKVAFLMPGLYTVKIVSGPVCLMNIVGDEKVITGTGGHNILGKRLTWGEFEKKYTKDGVELIYKRFKDVLVQLPDGSWLGKIMLGKRCLGYFYLINRFYLMGGE